MNKKSWNKGWDNVFSNYTWGKFPAEPLIRFICKNYGKIDKNKKLNVLEIGCGTGANLWFLSQCKFNTYGVDGSIVALNKSKKLLKTYNVKADLKKSDIIKLPYKNDFFDLIIDVECLYANSENNTKIILDEVYRVMKPKSKFLSISFSTKTTGYNSGKKYKNNRHTFTNLKKGPFKKNYGIIRFIDKLTIKKLYKKFKIEKLEKVSRTYNNLKEVIEEWVILLNKHK
jgi:ubiquinone/menaquinone biosynthesis C-methylase UbiE|tara:strand:- start:1746 stop:2429 length:684 start_codon:yes stop_codon:yes gene_type:complete